MSNISFQSSDYNNLFSSLSSSSASSSSGSDLTSLLGDYASIKNGSYSKLMKAYYAKDSKSTSSSAKENSKDISALKNVQTATDSLKSAADAITSKETIDYDSVKALVDSYNEVISTANNVTDKSTVNRATRMVSEVLANINMLSDIGISIDKDSKLSIDKDAFEAADNSKKNTLFKGVGSFAYSMSSKAALISQSAANAAKKLSGGNYTSNGSIDTSSANGNIFNSYT